MNEEETKGSIRKKIEQIRESIDEKEVISKSLKIERNFFKSIKLGNVNNLLIYLAAHKEVETRRVINTCFEKNINIFLPVVKEEKIFFSKVYNIGRGVEKGPFGIYQPIFKKQNILRDYNKIDLIVLPGLAFDTKGGRIGYGKGYYDKFLEIVPSHKLKIAFAFEFQIVEETKMSNNDVSVNKIVTERRIISCMED